MDARIVGEKREDKQVLLVSPQRTSDSNILWSTTEGHWSYICGSGQWPHLLAVHLAVLFTATVVLGADQIVTGYVTCDKASCAGYTIEWLPGSALGFTCAGTGACNGTSFNIAAGSSLSSQMSCDDADFGCYGAHFDISQSNLWISSNSIGLDCRPNSDSGEVLYEGCCDELKLTLVDSTLLLGCDAQSCRGLRAYLYDNSMLELYYLGTLPTSDQMHVYLMDAESSFVDNGIAPYMLFNGPTTTISPTTTKEPTTTEEPTTTTSKPTTTTLKPTTSTTSKTSRPTTTTPKATTTTVRSTDTSKPTTTETMSEKPTNATKVIPSDTSLFPTGDYSTNPASTESQAGGGSNDGFNILYAVVAAFGGCLLLTCIAVAAYYVIWHKGKHSQTHEAAATGLTVELQKVLSHSIIHEIGEAPVDEAPVKLRAAVVSSLIDNNEDGSSEEMYDVMPKTDDGFETKGATVGHLSMDAHWTVTGDGGDGGGEALVGEAYGGEETDALRLEYKTQIQSILVQMKIDAKTEEEKLRAKTFDLALSIEPKAIEDEMYALVQIGVDNWRIGALLVEKANEIVVKVKAHAAEAHYSRKDSEGLEATVPTTGGRQRFDTQNLIAMQPEGHSAITLGKMEARSDGVETDLTLDTSHTTAGGPPPRKC